MGKHNLKKETEELYNTICSMHSVVDARKEIKKFCNRHGLENKSVISRLYYYSSTNNLNSWQKTICENRSKEIGAMVSKDPSNIKEVCKKYIKKHYPDMKEGTEEYKRMMNSVYKSWFNNTSKKNVCFFMHGKNGGTIINRKNSKKANEHFKTGWFSTLKNFVKKLF